MNEVWMIWTWKRGIAGRTGSRIATRITGNLYVSDTERLYRNWIFV